MNLGVRYSGLKSHSDSLELMKLIHFLTGKKNKLPSQRIFKEKLMKKKKMLVKLPVAVPNTY